MDIYVALIKGANPHVLAELLALDIEVHGPDYKNGWTLEGSEADVMQALSVFQGFDMVRFFVVL